MTIFTDEAESELDRAREATLRAAAIAAGYKTYFTGKPCIWGHVAPRRVDNSTCIDCRHMQTARKTESKGKVYTPRTPKNVRRTDRMYGAAVGKDDMRRD